MENGKSPPVGSSIDNGAGGAARELPATLGRPGKGGTDAAARGGAGFGGAVGGGGTAGRAGGDFAAEGSGVASGGREAACGAGAGLGAPFAVVTLGPSPAGTLIFALHAGQPATLPAK